MKKDGGLARYKNKEERIKKVHAYNKTHYKGYNITLNKEKDADMINELDEAKTSKTEVVRGWFKAYKTTL